MSFNTPRRSARNAPPLTSQTALSTTPRHEPPSHLTAKSTTPLHEPPSSRIFGSSYNPPTRDTFGGRSRGFQVPGSSSLGDYEEDYDDDGDMDAEGEEEDFGLGGSRGYGGYGERMGAASPRGLKRSANGRVREVGESGMGGIAEEMAGKGGARRVVEEDEVVLGVEAVLAQVPDVVREEGEEGLAGEVARLGACWARKGVRKTRSGGVGPEAQDAVARADYVSSLLLQMHHPHVAAPAVASKRAVVSRRSAATPTPRALLDWINTFHTPYPDDFQAVYMNDPAPSAHESFWDVVYAELVRGRLTRVVQLLKNADWSKALTAQDEGGGKEGYEGRQLDNTEEVIDQCVQAIESCPALQDDNWNVRGVEWQQFRQRVRETIRELEDFANDRGSEDADMDRSTASDNIFAKSHEGGFSMSAASMRAASAVPWAIYENLKVVYGQLLGGFDEIIDTSQDWLEASIFLTVWWDGEDDAESTGMGRSGMRKSMGAPTREVDVAPLSAYRGQLKRALASVTDEMDEAVFKVDTMDPTQVGLACVLEDRVESVVTLLGTWSRMIAAAVVEVAAMGGWLPQANSGRGLLDQGFSSEDLMVLSHGPGQQEQQVSKIDRDQVLTEYAQLLSAKDVLRGRNAEREGWELAVSVLGRLNDAEVAQTKIAEVLERIRIEDEPRVEKVLQVCGNMRLTEQGRGIAERFAESVSTHPTAPRHGTALIYYARARAPAKIKATLGLLTSLSLLHSASMPPTADLDANLASLLSRERTALVRLARADADAATLLSTQLSGYGSVRRFFDLRDQDLAPMKPDKPLRPLERKREAAATLTRLVESAGDCIRGGLFDPAIESVVPVDSLLILFGEALPLLGHDKRIFTQAQTFALLRVVEDLAVAPERIRLDARGLLQAALNLHRGVASAEEGEWEFLAESVMGSASAKGEMRRAWDWRKGLDVVAGAEAEEQDVMGLIRVALAQEVSRGWGSANRW